MNTKTLIWRTETRKVDDLVPNVKNPRSLSAKQKADLEASITKFNLVEIPAVNTDNQVLAGHQRLKIMKALGRGQEEIDVRVPDRTLTEKECEEYMLRSNKNTGSWDFEMLQAFDTEFLLDIGFDDADLSDIWDDVLEIEDDEFNEEKEVEAAKETDIKAEIQAHNEFQESVLGRAVKEKVKIKDVDIRNYAKHILRKRPVYEKREVLSHLRSKMVLKEKKLSLVA